MLAIIHLRESLTLEAHAKASVQASDFVPTPLSEDQGAITRFFNGNQPQKAGGTLCTCNEFSSDLLTSALPHQAARLALQTRGPSCVDKDPDFYQ